MARRGCACGRLFVGTCVASLSLGIAETFTRAHSEALGVAVGTAVTVCVAARHALVVPKASLTSLLTGCSCVEGGTGLVGSMTRGHTPEGTMTSSETFSVTSSDAD